MDTRGGGSCSVTSNSTAACRVGSSTRSISAMDYEAARRACLRLLDSSKFDCLGEPYLLRPPCRPPALENHLVGPSGTKRPRCSSETESDTDVYQVDLTMDLSQDNGSDRGANQGKEEHEGYGAGVDVVQDEEGDELLAVPARHGAICEEHRARRREAP
ncbi:unnamed protein product [Mortierella alpina]